MVRATGNDGDRSNGVCSARLLLRRFSDEVIEKSADILFQEKIRRKEP
jgi:hypothetical protein